MRSNRFHLAIALLLVIVAAIPIYFLLDTIYQLPVAASTQATTIDTLFNAHFILISFLFSLVVVFMVYSLFVFRRRAGDDEEGQYIHGNTALEVAWTVAPLGLVIVFAIWGSQMLTDITSAQTDEMVVDVIGRQWAWQFSYPEQGGFTSSELVLPVNKPIRLEMESVDVLHSFWVPEFRVKQDLLPGRKTVLRITPNQEGEYKVRCAEICGLSHAYMLAPVRVASSSGFDQWVTERQNAPDPVTLTPAERGELWYTEYGCQGCHSLDGTLTGYAGPSWLGLFGAERVFTDGSTTIADEAYIRTSILLPYSQVVEGYQQVMPQNFGEQFAEREAEFGNQFDTIDDIIAFIKTLEP